VDVGTPTARSLERGLRLILAKILEFLLDNGVLWCILMHYFRAPIREAADSIIPGIFEIVSAKSCILAPS